MRDYLVRQVRTRYLLVLGSIAAISVIAFFTFFHLIHGNDIDVHAVNLVGRQRMLAHQIALRASSLADAPEDHRPEERRALLESISAMNEVHKDILSGDGVFAALRDPSLTTLLSGPEYRNGAAVAEYLAAATLLANLPDGTLLSNDPRIAHLRVLAEGPVLLSLERLIVGIERHIDRRVGNLAAFAIVGEAATLILLLFAALGVFRPMLTRMHEALSEVDKLFRAVEQSSAAIMITDAKGLIEYVNPKFCEITGYTSVESIGQNPNFLRSELEPPETYTNMWNAISNGREWHGEIVNRRKNGEMFWEHMAISPLKNMRGEITHFIAVKDDITDRKRWEETLVKAKDQAEDASKAKSEFLAHMSHELRTPLNAIIGFSEAIHLEIFGPVSNEKYADFVHNIHTSGHHLLTLINDILDLSKIEAGRMELELRELSLRELVDNVISILADIAAKRQVTLRDLVPNNLPMLVADPVRLRQVLFNLMSNAIKFTPIGGMVEISAEVDGDYLAISVADTGIGISKDELPRMLEPFSRSNHPYVRGAEGTGLGLPVAKRLVELHGGSLDIDSEAGRGTRATVRFRLLDSPSEI